MTYGKIEKIKLKNQEDALKGIELANAPPPTDPMQAMMMQMMMQKQQASGPVDPMQQMMLMMQQQQQQAPAPVDPMQQMMLQMQAMMQQQKPQPQQVYQQPEPVAPITPRGGFQMPITPRGMSFAQPTTPVLQVDDNQTAASSAMPVLSPQQMQMLFQQMQQQSR
jgi:hypothetical protein